MENQEYSKYANPMEFMRMFFRRKWLFFIPLYIGLVFSIIACFILPRTYESSTVILIEEEKTLNPLIQGLAVSTTALQRMQSIREILLGWNSLVSLTKRLSLDNKANSQLEFENLIMDLRKNIVIQMRGPNLIRMSYRGSEPKATQLVAQNLTDILVEENKRAQTKETDIAIEFIKEQLAIYKRKIKESEIAKLEEQLHNLLKDSTEQHPLVKDLHSKIAKVREELESGEYKVTETERKYSSPAYESLKKELDKIVNEAQESSGSGMAYAAQPSESDDPNKSLYKMFLMDKLDIAMARDMDVNEQIYNMLLQKLETAKITQRLEASKQGTRYTIVDPPRLPLKPVKPKIPLVIFLGLFLGGTAGTGLVIGKEFMDHSFLDIEDAKNNLDSPILGAISRLTTQEHILREAQRRVVWVLSFMGISVGTVVAAMLFALFKH